MRGGRRGCNAALQGPTTLHSAELASLSLKYIVRPRCQSLLPLPCSAGHGVTGGQSLPLADRAPFLAQLLKALAVRPPLVLVTPSMSGSYAL